MRTLDLDEAAAFLRMSPAVLRQKARQGLVKAAKPGKRWVFLEEDLADYLRSLYLAHRQAPQSGSSSEVTAWESTNAVMSGGSPLPIRTDAEYASLLGLKTGKKRRSCTTD
jgi:hypothetical protein